MPRIQSAWLAAIVLAGLASTSEPARGQLFKQGADLDAHRALGQQHLYDPAVHTAQNPAYAPTVAVKVEIPGFAAFTASGILAGPSTVVTAAHLFYKSGVNYSSSATVTVLTGANFNTDPGLVMSGSNVVVHPQFVTTPNPSTGPYSSLDAAKFTISQPLNVAPLSSVASLSSGQTATMTGRAAAL